MVVATLAGVTLVELIMAMATDVAVVIHLAVPSLTGIESTRAPPTMAPLTHSARSASR
jgi:Tfp pilus assembly protein FimT